MVYQFGVVLQNEICKIAHGTAVQSYGLLVVGEAHGLHQYGGGEGEESHKGEDGDCVHDVHGHFEVRCLWWVVDISLGRY